MPRKLDLRTGRPVWSAYRAPKVPVSRFTRDVKADVATVGMGVSGAMMAETLTAAGHGRHGRPARPAAWLHDGHHRAGAIEIDQPLTLLSKKIGKANTERAWRRSRLSLANLAARIDELGISCSCAPKQSL